MWTFEGKFGTLERVIEPHFAAACGVLLTLSTDLTTTQGVVLYDC